MAVLIIETDSVQEFAPISWNRFLWDITVGAFSSLERARIKYPEVKCYSPRFKHSLWSLLAQVNENDILRSDESINYVINSQWILAANFAPQPGVLYLSKFGDFLCLKDLEINNEVINLICDGNLKSLKLKYEVKTLENALFIRSISDIIKLNSAALENDVSYFRNREDIVSPSPNVYISKKAIIQQYVSLQTDKGPIIVDADATLRSFSIIDGPAYIGRGTLIDSAKIRFGSTIKHICRIGGEIENSVIESYTNKHHDGFIGHSYLGSWVNIGAMTTTSDLKNNYSNIRLQIGDKTVDTGVNKFGSIICDYAKLGIGLMLNTGTVIGQGVNLFQGAYPLPKYIPPFRWGEKDTYRLERFIEDLSKIMQRRGENLKVELENFLREFHKTYSFGG